jgi:hypothetical protein
MAYLSGHLIASVASCFDRLYDRLYANWQRLPKTEYRLSRLAKLKKAWKLKPEEGKDPLLSAAREIRARQIRELSLSSSESLGEENMLMWAQSHVTLRSSSASAEIERYQADSKFFRSMTVVLFVIIALTIFRELCSWYLLMKLAVALLISALFCYRFMYLRWEATKRAYEYFLLLALDKDKETGESFSQKIIATHL